MSEQPQLAARAASSTTATVADVIVRKLSTTHAESCKYHGSSTAAEISAVSAFWTERYGRMNSTTHNVGIPCSLLLVTRQRMRLEMLLREAQTNFGILFANMRESEKIRLFTEADHFPLSDNHYHDAKDNLAQVVAIDNVATLTHHRNEWELLKEESRNGTMKKHYDFMRDSIKLLKLLSASVKYFTDRLTVLKEVESKLVVCMYPSTIEDIYEMLELHGIESRTALVLSGFGSMENEKCCLCSQRTVQQAFVCISSRCVLHSKCIDARLANKTCACVNKFIHLDCLARDMLAEYTGVRNDGVGRQPLCPLCRGVYCFLDLVPIRVQIDHTPKRLVETETAEEMPESLNAKEPAKKKVRVCLPTQTETPE